jgi:hypothetical protein
LGWAILIWRLLPREGRVLVLAGLLDWGLAVLEWYDMGLVAECLAQNCHVACLDIIWFLVFVLTVRLTTAAALHDRGLAGSLPVGTGKGCLTLVVIFLRRPCETLLIRSVWLRL